MVRVDSLQRNFGKVAALRGVSFEVGAGKIAGLIGPNGAGKTTTMRILSTLETADSGGAWVNDIDVLQDPQRVAREVGFMPDAFGNYHGLPVVEYLEFFARIYGLHGQTRQQAMHEVIEFTELGKLLDRPMETLSKGMRQRLGLAKTLIHDPKVLILDEPAAGLDPRARVEFRELCVALAARGKTLLISSHILTELAEFCDVIVIIEHGGVVASGTMDEIQARSRPHRVVRVRFLRDEPATGAMLTEIPTVQNVRWEGKAALFDFLGDEEQLADLAEAFIKAGYRFSEFHCQEERLEDVFMKLTRGGVG
jgi:ABC-2 type transport system ATP-binding protein